VPSGAATPPGDRGRARSGRGCPAAGPARTPSGGSATRARAVRHRGPRCPGTPPRRDASVAPRADRARPLCLTLSQSWGAPADLGGEHAIPMKIYHAGEYISGRYPRQLPL